MGISDFGQVSRLISKRFQEGISPRKDGKRRLKVAESPCCAWISKAEARTEVIRAVRKKKSYEMNKCLSLVHLTTNSLVENEPTRDFLGLPIRTPGQFSSTAKEIYSSVLSATHLPKGVIMGSCG